MSRDGFSRAVLDIDPAQVADEIATALAEIVFRGMARRGAVVALSGGVDSSVVLALAARGLGPENVLGLLMPEAESAAETRGLAEEVAASVGAETVFEDITPILTAARCYERRDDAIRSVIPGFSNEWKANLVLPTVLAPGGFRLPSVVAESPTGERVEARLSSSAYREIVAATNFKQRTRKMLEYYHADRLEYAVAGTPNRLEYDQGFFVKNGDGAADVKPIAHLYKTQVYRLAEFLGLPDGVRDRAPTTDTYSLPQTQEEFYFGLPYEEFDLCLYAHDHGVPPDEVAPAVGLTPEEVDRVFRDIDQKRRTTRYLHLPAQLV